jgi:ABC-type polysaccharide/polyol phosphate export permease
VAIVAEPVWPDPSFTVTVRLLPALVGVTLALLNTPAVNAADVPVTPAVPPNVTVDMKLVTVLLFASCAVIVAMVNAVPAVLVPEIDEIAKLLTAPGLTVKGALFPAVRESPVDRVAFSTTPLSAFV